MVWRTVCYTVSVMPPLPAVDPTAPFDPVAIARQTGAFEGRAAEAILAWVMDALGHLRVGCTSAFGPEGCVLADLVRRRWPDTPIYTIDTGLLFEASVEVRRAHAARGARVVVVEPLVDLRTQAGTHGPALWDRDPDACCALRKVAPMRRILDRLDVWITAIRRDQAPTRANTPVLSVARRADGSAVLKVAPFVRWTRKDTWRYLLDHQVPYNRLLDEGYDSIGCRPCTVPSAGAGGERAGRWRGRAKTECGIHNL